MPTQMPANAKNRATPDDVGMVFYRVNRIGEDPEIHVAFAPREIVEENGNPKKNAYGKNIHRIAHGWQAWHIILGKGCEARIAQLLQDATAVVLNGAGNVDIDAAMEQVGIELENERQAGTLPAAARIEGTPPENQ